MNSQEDTISAKITFYKMLCPTGLELAKPYLNEERQCLLNFFEKNCDVKFNSIVVGAGPLLYLDVAKKFVTKYIAVDPIVDMFACEYREISNVTMIRKEFSDLKSEDLPSTNRVFIFVFNVISYIDKLIASINRLIVPGDILIFSTWSDSSLANNIAKRYFSYVHDTLILTDDALEKVIPRYDVNMLVSSISHTQAVQTINREIIRQYIIEV